MRILIVDDIHQRYARLLPYLEKLKVSRDDLQFAGSATDARRFLETEKFDLLILDIVLPLRLLEEPQGQHSYDLLMELVETDTLMQPRHLVGISAESDAAERYLPFFEEHLWTIVEYSDSHDGWCAQISNCIQYMLAERNSQPPEQYGVDLAIVCALPTPELDAVLNLPWNWAPARPLDANTFLHEGRFVVRDRTITVAAAAAPRMGMVSSALLASKMISRTRPRLLTMTGICAGVKGKVGIGDVIAADPSWDWQSGKRTRDKRNTQFTIAPHQLDLNSVVRAHLDELKKDREALTRIGLGWAADPTQSLSLVIGPMASGSAVLADGKVIDLIKDQHRLLLGIEMEVYGVYAAARAATRPAPCAFALKAVCDFGDPEKDDKYQRYASYTSANVLKLLMERYGPEILDAV